MFAFKKIIFITFLFSVKAFSGTAFSSIATVDKSDDTATSIHEPLLIEKGDSLIDINLGENSGITNAKITNISEMDDKNCGKIKIELTNNSKIKNKGEDQVISEGDLKNGLERYICYDGLFVYYSKDYQLLQADPTKGFSVIKVGNKNFPKDKYKNNTCVYKDRKMVSIKSACGSDCPEQLLCKGQTHCVVGVEDEKKVVQYNFDVSCFAKYDRNNKKYFCPDQASACMSDEESSYVLKNEEQIAGGYDPAVSTDKNNSKDDGIDKRKSAGEI